MITTTNPATGRVITTFPYHETRDISRIVADSATTFAAWRRVGLARRTAVLTAVADRLRLAGAELAGSVVAETGKPVTQANAEIDKSLRLCAHYAAEAHRYLAEEPIVRDEAGTIGVRFDPIGPILAIMPWNYPVWQVVRAAVPALLAGNTLVLKHAEITTGTAALIEEVFRTGADYPGLLTTLRMRDEDIASVITSPRIRGVTLTGSVRAGRSVAATAGAALKPSLLELGGSDAFLVYDDADLAAAATAAVTSRMLNGGQSCIAAKRFVVASAVADEFVERCRAALDTLRTGDPTDPRTEVGPLARQDVRASVHNQVMRTVEEGALLVTGGGTPDGPGYYYPPTILDHVRPGMTAAAEETFGPVFATIRAETEPDMIEIANHTAFGLGASVWTADPARAEAVIADLDVGQVFVNRIVQSEPRVPFGGTKDSGIGRELGGPGITAFTNLKSVATR